MHGVATKVVYEELWGPGLKKKRLKKVIWCYWLERSNREADNMSRSLTEPWGREIKAEIKGPLPQKKDPNKHPMFLAGVLKVLTYE